MDTEARHDARFMAVALTIGRRELGRTWPNPAVGAVLVQTGAEGPIVVGRGWTQAGGRPHAEVEALRRAGAAARGATLYVTLEPCSHHGKTPPCADAIIAAGVKRVVSALEDPNPAVRGQGHARLRACGIAVDVGICAEEARRAHAGHIRRVLEGRPHVILKLALSADDKAGHSGPRPAAITGPAARDRVHLMRAQADAILIGIGTALADDPLLTCRLPGMENRSPVRVVLDRGLRLPLASRLVATARTTPLWLITHPGAPAEKERMLRAAGAQVWRVEGELLPVLKHLAAQGITRLMVEGGPTVAAAFLRADLVDEAVLFRSPRPLGPEGIDGLAGLPLTALTRSARLTRISHETLGDDTAETFARF
jgi:diaminohydroxyphosphoribosylaminopyrimidine deaminase/5-amino-6-(5-phosphoribosylamino)uracil reductase